jgi:hypothetical protein
MKVTLWKLGSLDHAIIPTNKAVNKLARILKKANKENLEEMDLIWGPDIEIEQFETSGNNVEKTSFTVKQKEEVVV